MSQESPNPQINVSKIPGGGGLAGVLFAVGGMLIFLIGIPRFRFFLLAAAVLGCGIALILQFVRRETPGKPWTLAKTQDAESHPSDAPAANHPPQDLRRSLQALSPA